MKNEKGVYVVHGKSYPILEGSRVQVYRGVAYKTSGGLTKKNIYKNKRVGKMNEKDIHKHNTYECLQKTILLLETIPKKIFNDIKKEFKDLEKDPIYGIPSKMKLELFIQNLKQFQLHDLDNYIDSLK